MSTFRTLDILVPAVEITSISQDRQHCTGFKEVVVVVVGAFAIVEIPELYFCSPFPSTVLNGNSELGPARRKPTAATHRYNFCVTSVSWPCEQFLLSDEKQHPFLVLIFYLWAPLPRVVFKTKGLKGL